MTAPVANYKISLYDFFDIYGANFCYGEEKPR